MEKILIVDDDYDFRFNISNVLKDEGYDVLTVPDGKDAIKAVETNSFNLLFLDIRLPQMDGMKILEKIKKLDKDLIVIMLTAYADIKSAVKAMKLGAFDYITKPFDNEELFLIIKKALNTQNLTKELDILRKRLGEKIVFEQLMGDSPRIKQVLKQVEIIAPVNLTVIIQGDSGTGKELIANLIHQKSKRNEQPFIPIDCGTIPETLVESELFGYEKGAFTGADTQKEGKFQQANGGTLFLDEITNLSDAMQVKLLRVIQERKIQRLGGAKDIKIDVRIIVATNANLMEAVRNGRFRDDLFHRLNEFCINLPLLRERKEDVPILVRYFLDEANQEFNKKIDGVSTEAMKSLLNHHWPGNVRELKNVIKRAVLLTESNYIVPSDLLLNDASESNGSTSSFGRLRTNPERSRTGSSTINPSGMPFKDLLKKASEVIAKQAIKETLAKVDGNKTKAAKLLKIDRMTLYSKIKELGLEEYCKTNSTKV